MEDQPLQDSCTLFLHLVYYFDLIIKNLEEYVPRNVDIVPSKLREGVQKSKVLFEGGLAWNTGGCKNLSYNVWSSKHALVEAVKVEEIRSDNLLLKAVLSSRVKELAYQCHVCQGS
jgi:hypothetical protein